MLSGTKKIGPFQNDINFITFQDSNYYPEKL